MTSDSDALTAQIHQLVPFAATLGIQVEHLTPGEVRAQVAWSPGLCTSDGVLHGGTLMALADTTGAVCAFQNLPEHAKGTTTIESKTNFLRAVRDGVVTATSRPVHAGRTVIVVDTELRDGQDRLVARVTQSQLVLSG